MGNMITIALMLDERRKYNEKREKLKEKLGASLAEPFLNNSEYIPLHDSKVKYSENRIAPS